MAATALSIAEPSPKPVLVASRRHGVSRRATRRFRAGRTRRWTGSSPTAPRHRDRLVADGIPRTKITIVNDGVDVERIVRMQAANVHAAFYLPTQAPIVGNVAALVPHKGQHHLIDAAEITVRQVPDVRFVIVGDGELRQRSRIRSGTSTSSATCFWPASVTTRWS